jgi:carbon monoxide dehydrogenase subunit G
MAMTMSGEATLPAARPKVWAMLNDADVLKACIPGCQSLEKTGDNGFAAVAKIKIGPVSATFSGKVQLSDIVPDVGYTISGEGEGGVAGFAKGGAKVSLADATGGTLLRYDVEAHVGGKIAQLGSRLIDSVAKGMADKFFTSFAEAAKAGALGPAPAQPGRADAKAAPVAPGPTASAPFAPARRPAQTLSAPPPSRPTAAATAVSPPKKKSWFRRIWEWFRSR